MAAIVQGRIQWPR